MAQYERRYPENDTGELEEAMALAGDWLVNRAQVKTAQPTRADMEVSLRPDMVDVRQAAAAGELFGLAALELIGGTR
jgi:hypothetical protein